MPAIAAQTPGDEQHRFSSTRVYKSLHQARWQQKTRDYLCSKDSFRLTADQVDIGHCGRREPKHAADRRDRPLFSHGCCMLFRLTRHKNIRSGQSAAQKCSRCACSSCTDAAGSMFNTRPRSFAFAPCCPRLHSLHSLSRLAQRRLRPGFCIRCGQPMYIVQSSRTKTSAVPAREPIHGRHNAVTTSSTQSDQRIYPR